MRHVKRVAHSNVMGPAQLTTDPAGDAETQADQWLRPAPYEGCAIGLEAIAQEG